MRRKSGHKDANAPIESTRNRRNSKVLFGKFVDDSVSRLRYSLHNIPCCNCKNIKKDVDHDNGDERENRVESCAFCCLDNMPPKSERTNPNSEKKGNNEKFFHFEPPLTFGV